MKNHLVTTHSVLEIKDFVLPVRIGRDSREREKPQKVAFHIVLGFTKALKDEQSDHLENSLCYSEICAQIKKLTEQNCFSLIEKLAFETLTVLKAKLPEGVLARVRVHKIHPPVPNLKGGVFYTCGDFFLKLTKF